MPKPTFAVLTEKDKQLVLETEPAKLAELDEDQLIALHDRVRRARDRHTKNYRRGAAERVEGGRRRAGASDAQARDRARAEVLEDALARVSRRLAAEAKASADALRAERLAAARKAKPASSEKSPGQGKPEGLPTAARPRRTPASKKVRAATRAAGKRAQAARDDRR